MARRPSSRKKKSSKAAPAPRRGKAARPSAKKRTTKAAPGSKAGAKGQWVYAFGGGKAQGRSGMKDLLGGIA